MYGIDFASVDHNEVDFVAVARGQKSFVLLRACYGMELDDDFARFWPAAKEAGLVRGAYLFCRPLVDDPIAVTENFLDVMGPVGPGDFPPTLDLETLRGDPWDPAQVVESTRQMIEVVKLRLGVAPIVYTSNRVWTALQSPLGTGFRECPLWVADWRPESLPEPLCPEEWGDGNWLIHQFAGDTKNIAGVSKQADLDRFNVQQIGTSGPRAAWINTVLQVPSGDTFDVATRDAVQRFQREQGLQTDGIVGPLTWAHLVWLV